MVKRTELIEGLKKTDQQTKTRFRLVRVGGQVSIFRSQCSRGIKHRYGDELTQSDRRIRKKGKAANEDSFSEGARW